MRVYKGGKLDSITVLVDAPHEESKLRSLHQWLLGEPELRGEVDYVISPATSGQMGGAIDAITIAIGGGGTASILAKALIEWIRSQHSSISIRLKDKDKNEVVVEGQGRAADAIIRKFIQGRE